MSYYRNPNDKFGPQYPRRQYEPIGNGKNLVDAATTEPGAATGAATPPDAKVPRSDWLIFTDLLTDVAKQMGIVIEGEFTIRREEDPDKVVVSRYYLLGSPTATPGAPRRVQWGERKKTMPGPWNTADTHGFKPVLAGAIKQLESKGVRFIEDSVDGEFRVTARFQSAQPIRRTASTAESAYQAVVTAAKSLWVAQLSSQTQRY